VKLLGVDWRWYCSGRGGSGLGMGYLKNIIIRNTGLSALKKRDHFIKIESAVQNHVPADFF